jgi:uncharacterized protein (TIGR03382 family)
MPSGTRWQAERARTAVVFQNSSGSELFSEPWTGPTVLTAINNGNGGAGYLFNIGLTQAQIAQFFSDPTNRIGIRVDTPILNTAGGPENFYILPAPSAIGVLLLGWTAAVRRRR